MLCKAIQHDSRAVEANIQEVNYLLSVSFSEGRSFRENILTRERAQTPFRQFK